MRYFGYALKLRIISKRNYAKTQKSVSLDAVCTVYKFNLNNGSCGLSRHAAVLDEFIPNNS